MRFLPAASAAALCVATLAVAGRSSSAMLDANFTESAFVTAAGSGGFGTTSIAWAFDGTNRLFLAKKDGTVRIIKDGVLLATPFATVTPVYTASECGIIGIALDPNFVTNGYVYLFVTVSGSEQQIIRYTASGDVGTAKTTIVSGLPTLGANHDGGSLGFGPDGKIYWG